MPIRRLFLLAVGLAMSLGANAATKHNDIRAANTPFDHHDNTGPYRKGAELVRHAQNQMRLAAQSTTLAAVESVDVGDVAVIVDNGSILIPPKPSNPFDLGAPSALLFVPGTDEFAVSAPGTEFDLTIGGNLGLGDDDAAQVEGTNSGTFAGFPFLGTAYTTDQIFVGSDGHITFGEPEASSSARDAGRHIGGPPRVSPFFTDLDPSVAGAVHADVRTDRVVITWSGVPTFGVANSNTFQAVLHSDGSIDFVYSNVEEKFGVVGVAEGNDEGPINPIDLSADLPGTFGAGAVFEEFSPAILVQQMDVIALAKEFYKTHGDKYDFLVMFSDEVVDIGGGFAFHLGLHSDTEGLGYFRGNSIFVPGLGVGGLSSVFDNCDVVGLGESCELESLLNMNRIGLYWPDERKQVDPPIRKFRFFCLSPGGQVVPCGATFGGPPSSDQASIRARWMGTLNGDFGFFGSYTLGLNSAMSIMGQEAGHRWLAFPAFFDFRNFPSCLFSPPFCLSNKLLGRSDAHWSFFHDVSVEREQFEDADGDPRASSMEGNAITDLGADTFCQNEDLGSNLFQTKPNELIDGYTPLDQYFIGTRLPSDVPDFWYIDNPTTVFGGNPNPSSDARDDVLICGDKLDVSLAEITFVGDVAFNVPSNGTRDPLIGDEQDAGPGIGAADDAKCTNDRECVDVKTMAFILVIGDDPGVAQSTIDAVNTFRQTWEDYANGPALGGRGARGMSGDENFIPKFDTSLDPVIR